MTESRMFTINGRPMKTWNVLFGCHFSCTYCSVRSLVATRLKNSPKYAHGMEPGIAEREINRNFRPGDWVFVGYMGDVACQPIQNLRPVLERIEQQPEVNFYFQSKDPACFLGWMQTWHPVFPPNVTFGTTLETNRTFTGVYSNAPPPIARFEAMVKLALHHHRRTIVSIEPVMDFDLGILAWWLSMLEPVYIFLGANNYHNGPDLPEPSASRVRSLIEAIEAMPNRSTTLIQKPGLERLL